MTEDELYHHGVLGMKWGKHRAKATGREIKAARRNLHQQSKAYRSNFKKFDKAKEGTKTKAQLETKLRTQQVAYLKNPDRVIAARMTRGEKFSALLFGAETGAGVAVSIASIAGTSAMSRRIEQKQEDGAYNSTSKKPLPKFLGKAQMTRTLTLAGAAAAPRLAKLASEQVGGRIIVKAAANRNAAKDAPKAIASAAAKIAYAAKRGGVHKITTMK